MNWVDLSGMSGGGDLPSVTLSQGAGQSDCSIFQDRLKSKDKQMQELRTSLIEARKVGGQCDTIRSELDATKANERNLETQLKNAELNATKNADANSFECPACPDSGAEAVKNMMPFLNCGQVDQRNLDFEMTARDPQDPMPMGITVSVMKDKSVKVSMRVYPGLESATPVSCPYYMTQSLDRETLLNGGKVCFDPSDSESCFDFKNLMSLTDKDAMRKNLGKPVGKVREDGGEFEDLIFSDFSESRSASGPAPAKPGLLEPNPNANKTLQPPKNGTPSRQRVQRKRSYMRKLLDPIARLSF